MTEQRPGRGDLDAILERAVERQLSEQRALRQALEDLRVAIEEVGRAVDASTSGGVGDDEPRRWREVETTIGRLSDEVADLRTVLDPHHEVTASVAHAVKTLRDEVGSTRDAVGGVSADVDGIASALVELNTGLREWAGDLDASVSSLRELTESVRPHAEIVEPSTAEATDDVAPVPMSPDVIGRIADVQQQLQETADLSLYLSDQIEDLDRIIGQLGELPERIEGVVTQGLRRTLAARAKLEQEATGAVDEAVEVLGETFEQLNDALSGSGLKDVRKLSLGQVELTSRVEALHELLGEIEDRTQRNLEALARAIDKVAAGRAPKALEALARPRSKGKPKKTKASSKKSAKPRATRSKAKSATARRKGSRPAAD